MRRLLILLMLALVGCDAKMSDRQDASLKQQAIDAKKACDRGQCPCETPVGTIEHGSKIPIFSRDSVACNEGCGTYQQDAVCENGQLSLDTTGMYFRCRVLECPPCVVGENLIKNGDSVEMFKEKEVGCRASCEDDSVKQMRTCVMGVLSGDPAFQHFTCERKQCRCELPENQGYVSLDGTVLLYSTSAPACGSSCLANSAERTCVASTSGGVETYNLNGNAAFTKRTCTDPINCFCTLPNNLGTMLHGQVKTISTVQSVACGQTCLSQPSVTVRCDNAVFKDIATGAVVNFGTAAYQNYQYECTVDTCVSCQVPGTQILVPHLSYHTFFKAASVPCSEQCQSVSRQCLNGTFAGDTTYTFHECARGVCKCPVPGLPGTDVPVGDPWTFYSASKPACGSTCASIGSPRTCTEVVGTGGVASYVFGPPTSHSFGKCDPPTGCSCLLPNGLGQIADTKTEVLISLQEVPCGTTCDQAPSLKVKCDNGLLVRDSDGSAININDPTFPFKWRCNKGTCTACNLPGYGTIAIGQSITLYAKDVMGCADQPELLTFEFRCENGALLRNNLPYNPAQDPNAPSTWYTSYSINCPGCALPWGGQIAEGGTVIAYKNFGTVINGCGRGCKQTERKCEHGVLLGDAEYTLKECNNSCNMEGGGAPPRLCLLRWQNSYVTPDAQVPMWNTPRVGCNDSCQNHFKLGRCKMEKGIFDVPFEYMYSSCTEVCP